MILYDFGCEQGHVFEASLESMFDNDPACLRCGGATRRRPSRVNIGGAADAGPSREQMPQSWRATHGGDPDTVRHWHRLAEKREKLEERHPELAGDRRPVLAHEGIFQGAPLRAGDDIGAAVHDRLASGARPHSHVVASDDRNTPATRKESTL
ncbi:zinc ribbon domain-containing protein [Nesterenkonia salmonea]|uniref:zinc ribbon domain-containing protein n=1 Tax=Nesterenkonia salmonea TaxID=1804987 RepID=UPI001AA09845|nr:zinc ribbon domain-containing protein [Nesterenkonia salmonea]